MPVAAALNGVKGTGITLNSRRHWEKKSDAGCPSLDKAVKQGELSPKTLEALIAAMEESLPRWRQYLRAKASLLKIDACAFYDLFAPVGGQGPVYDWKKARATLLEDFFSFSPRMGTFVNRAFASSWIDAEPRRGKVGGAYMTGMPAKKEPRILCNFDNTFNSVMTLAHELGHAFHFDVMKNLPGSQQGVPMTLAETASTFSETIIFNAELKKNTRKSFRLGLLEKHLQDGCQIIVDILSRFYFEKEVFALREKGELPADEFCRIMADAQKKTYGDGLDPENLHPYMWLVKSHYYSSGLAFYNFPYAFGQLLGMALYSRYLSEGSGFAETYESILLATGSMDAVALTASAGFNIEDISFWRSGLEIFYNEIDDFCALAETHAAAG
ncbi:M3 family metallopeptidase [Brucepastera parasyntrophica]|uniref:M3 family metallopeptidase n=1 Tax=Brucepastera parasyntrophica TaxID=2880008 RepID=UPI00210901A5|nr:M3 family metallopeptidase [Brucepastera parasyntrophica]ULQ58885.1 M3 family metallopeptidase [Brucepastera parasyntrophica]